MYPGKCNSGISYSWYGETSDNSKLSIRGGEVLELWDVGKIQSVITREFFLHRHGLSFRAILETVTLCFPDPD